VSRAHGTEAWRRLAKQRVALGRALGEPCGMCGQPLDYSLDGRRRMGPTADHPDPLAWGGALLPGLDELRVVHRACNARQGQRIKTQRERARKAQGGGGSPRIQATTTTSARTRASAGGGASLGRAPLLRPPSGADSLPESAPEWWGHVGWLADIADKPRDAAWPRAISAPHPLAVGTYGTEVEAEAREHLHLDLRWWQRLAVRMQLQHDAEGRLLIREAYESTPRRAGKSVRLRAGALWRLRHADRFGEEQLVMHTGKDLNICREVIRRAWPLADRWGWTSRKANGQEEIEASDGSRWMIRGKDSVYGYDVTVGLVDEAWAVAPGIVDDGLEPATLERIQPQLVLTSTAHRRATPLMLRRLRSVDVDPEVLVMLWGAPEDADPSDPAAWRAASPHWSTDRERLLTRKWAAAAAGELDADAEDDDPVEGFKAQYLNIWPHIGRRETKAPDLANWASLPGVPSPEPPPGCVVALDQAPDGSVVGVMASWRRAVWYREVASLDTAWRLVRSWKPSALVVGLSLRGAAAMAGWPGVAAYGSSETAEGTPLLLEAVRSGTLAHEHLPALTTQAEGAVLTLSDTGTLRLSVKGSKASVLGLKLAAWALVHDRNVPNNRPRIW
jgi:hypothetical protein